MRCSGAGRNPGGYRYAAPFHAMTAYANFSSSGDGQREDENTRRSHGTTPADDRG